MGIDILDVLQFSAKDMDPAILKQQHGKQLSFHGGIDIQQVLPNCTVEEVRENVRNLIHVLGVGGGYIVAPTHNIQPDIPPENVIAIYEAAQSMI
jgi:uroporphyrinogen decarboxylase